MGLPPPKHYAMDGETYSSRQLTREERIENHRISRGRRLSENVFGIIVSRFRVQPCNVEQRPKVVRDIAFTCVVLYNILRTHQGVADRVPTPENDVVALLNEQVVYVEDDSYRIPLGEAKHQGDLLKNYFTHMVTLAGQEDMI